MLLATDDLREALACRESRGGKEKGDKVMGLELPVLCLYHKDTTRQWRSNGAQGNPPAGRRYSANLASIYCSREAEREKALIKPSRSDSNLTCSSIFFFVFC